MAKNIIINYNTGLGYEELYPYTTPSLIGTYSKEELNNEIDSRFRWTKFLETDVTSVTQTANYFTQIQLFPANTITYLEDSLIKFNGTIEASFKNNILGAVGLMMGIGLEFDQAIWGSSLMANLGTTSTSQNFSWNIEESESVYSLGTGKYIGQRVGESNYNYYYGFMGNWNGIYNQYSSTKAYSTMNEAWVPMYFNTQATYLFIMPSSTQFTVGTTQLNITGINLHFELYKRPSILGMNPNYQ